VVLNEAEAATVVWQNEGERARLDAATAQLDAPFAVVDVGAFDANATDLARRAEGVPIRVASKSLRCRWALDRALEGPATHGVMSFTLPEAIWLAELGHDDLLVAYPTVDRAALRRLAEDPELAGRITIMVDDTDQLDVVDAVAAPQQRAQVRVCLDLDASLRLFDGRVHLGVRRSPVHDPAQARRLAEAVVGRPGFVIDGLMAYEAQIAGVGDQPAQQAWRGPAIRAMQHRSAAELAERRAAAVEAVRAVADLRFVNGGGTGSLETTRREGVVTEVTAGSGYYGPGLFDDYTAFLPQPAALFALPVVRRPGAGVVTLLGGGYLASGPGDPARLPRPFLPAGLGLLGTEGAGEVQTPVRGPAADRLGIGARVWLRHAKAGELCERFDVLHLVDGEEVVDAVPTYRGEGRTFL
jgi:D-serine deaminase-like pyridoxal phosphate-dependent protein